jgi:hypothetical protein
MEVEMSAKDWDLSQLEGMWERRRAAVEKVLRRTDRKGMTRPVRDPEEREWLLRRGELDPAVEVEVPSGVRRLPFRRRRV